MYLHLLVGGILACGLSTAPASTETNQAPSTDAATADSTDAPQEPWPSLNGSGLMLLQDTSTLPPKHLNAGFTIENQDRDPTRIDVLDFSLAWTYGISRRAETYGHVVTSRAVAIADRTTLLPPPLDLILPQGSTIPDRPYYPLYSELPYVNRSGSSQLGRFVLGDAVFGGKVRLLSADGLRPALAVSAELKIPVTRALSKLQSGSGTGAWDETMRFTTEWRAGSRSIVASLDYTHVGAPPFGDRLILFGPGAGAGTTDLPLRLESRLGMGVGIRQVLSKRMALVAEATRSVPFGGHTLALDAAGPLDISVGTQVRWSHLFLTTGFRFHVNSVPFSRTYAMSLGGLVDLTSVSAGDLRSYLTAIGAADALPEILARRQIAVAAPAGGPPLPSGAQTLADDYVVKSHDRVAYVFAWGWSFGGGGKP
jgi:hypothetical protein